MTQKLFLILLLLSSFVRADVIYEKLDQKDFFGRNLVTLTISGSIKEGDYKKLEDVLAEINQNDYRLKEDSIYLNSNGGLISEAKNMGHIIRSNHHATKVEKEAKCESACIFILISGSCRMAEGDVGLHRARTDYNFKNIKDMDEYIDNKTDISFLKGMGANQDLIDAIYNLPHWDMRYMNNTQKFKAGLFSTSERESHYWQEVVSRKIAAPKSFLLAELEERNYQLYENVTWYDKWFKGVDPDFIFPSCTEQMFLDQLEKYPIGTDDWEKKFQLNNWYQGYDFTNEKGEIQTFYESQVPLMKDIYHFWTIAYYQKGVKEITYREETTLAKPTEWNSDEDLTISLGGRRVVRNITVPNTGILTNGWVLDPKVDPTGPMTVRVYIDNELIQEFKYEIISREQFKKQVTNKK